MPIQSSGPISMHSIYAEQSVFTQSGRDDIYDKEISLSDLHVRWGLAQKDIGDPISFNDLRGKGSRIDAREVTIGTVSFTTTVNRFMSTTTLTHKHDGYNNGSGTNANAFGSINPPNTDRGSQIYNQDILEISFQKKGNFYDIFLIIDGECPNVSFNNGGWFSLRVNGQDYSRGSAIYIYNGTYSTWRWIVTSSSDNPFIDTPEPTTGTFSNLSSGSVSSTNGVIIPKVNFTVETSGEVEITADVVGANGYMMLFDSNNNHIETNDDDPDYGGSPFDDAAYNPAITRTLSAGDYFVTIGTGAYNNSDALQGFQDNVDVANVLLYGHTEATWDITISGDNVADEVVRTKVGVSFT